MSESATGRTGDGRLRDAGRLKDDGRLKDKVAIVTGAARGQGAAEAALFAAEDRMASRTPFRRAAEPGEIATLALYLASAESSFSSGSELVADGGIMAT